MGLKGLLYSTNFWNAIIGSAVAIGIYYVTQSEGITLAVIGLFGIRALTKGAQDLMQRSLGGTNPPPDKDEK